LKKRSLLWFLKDSERFDMMRCSSIVASTLAFLA